MPKIKIHLKKRFRRLLWTTELEGKVEVEADTVDEVIKLNKDTKLEVS